MSFSTIHGGYQQFLCFSSYTFCNHVNGRVLEELVNVSHCYGISFETIIICTSFQQFTGYEQFLCFSSNIFWNHVNGRVLEELVNVSHCYCIASGTIILCTCKNTCPFIREYQVQRKVSENTSSVLIVIQFVYIPRNNARYLLRFSIISQKSKQE